MATKAAAQEQLSRTLEATGEEAKASGRKTDPYYVAYFAWADGGVALRTRRTHLKRRPGTLKDALVERNAGDIKERQQSRHGNLLGQQRPARSSAGVEQAKAEKEKQEERNKNRTRYLDRLKRQKKTEEQVAKHRASDRTVAGARLSIEKWNKRGSKHRYRLPEPRHKGRADGEGQRQYRRQRTAFETASLHHGGHGKKAPVPHGDLPHLLAGPDVNQKKAEPCPGASRGKPRGVRHSSTISPLNCTGCYRNTSEMRSQTRSHIHSRGLS